MSMTGIHGTENGPLSRVETGPELRDLKFPIYYQDTDKQIANNPI